MLRMIPLAISFFLISALFAQDTKCFEQTAFDYFKDSILPKESLKSKLLFQSELGSYHKYPFRWPGCLGIYSVNDFIGYNYSGCQRINIKPSNLIEQVDSEDSRMVCFVLQACRMKNGNSVVSVIIKQRAKTTAYRIDINNLHSVTSWCKEVVFVHES